MLGSYIIMPPFRVAVGGVEHETAQLMYGLGLDGSTTEWEHFITNSLGGLERGPEVLGLEQTNTVIGGFLTQCGKERIEPIPLCYAKARTGGPVSKETLERLVAEVLVPLEAALPVDGVLISLHGAFCAEDEEWVEDDADGYMLMKIRELVGPETLVFAVHDLHCNISQLMVDNADFLCVERTYPHVDMAERASHAAEVMARALRKEIGRPAVAWRPIPILWSAKKMLESEQPFGSLVAALDGPIQAGQHAICRREHWDDKHGGARQQAAFGFDRCRLPAVRLADDWGSSDSLQRRE
eukprot:SAG11_NODE_2084_length_3847_cov_2.877801_4_plen_297_part_00